MKFRQSNKTKTKKHTMKTLMLLMGCLAIVAMLIPLALAITNAAPHAKSIRQLRRALGFPVNVCTNALGDGVHESGILSKRADATHSYRYLLVKTGTDADHVAVNGASDKPLGLCADTPEAAEDPANVHLLGAVKGTQLCVASEAITAGSDLYTAASGKVQNEPTSAGTYYRIGRAVTASGADLDVIEFEPCLPQLVKIVANGSTLAQTQAAMSGGAIVIVL
jgi:hypothetical protein